MISSLSLNSLLTPVSMLEMMLMMNSLLMGTDTFLLSGISTLLPMMLELNKSRALKQNWVERLFNVLLAGFIWTNLVSRRISENQLWPGCHHVSLITVNNNVSCLRSSEPEKIIYCATLTSSCYQWHSIMSKSQEDHRVNIKEFVALDTSSDKI